MDTEKAWKEFRANDSEQVVKSSTAAMLEAILSQQNALNAKLDLMRNDGAEPPEGGTDVPPMPPMGGAPPMGGEEEGGEPPAEGAETMPPMDATALMGGVPENLGGTEPPEQMPPAGEGGTAPAVDDGAMPLEMPPMDDTEGDEVSGSDEGGIGDLLGALGGSDNAGGGFLGGDDKGYDDNIGAITDAIVNMTDPEAQLDMTGVLQNYLTKKVGAGAPDVPPAPPMDMAEDLPPMDEALTDEPVDDTSEEVMPEGGDPIADLIDSISDGSTPDDILSEDESLPADEKSDSETVEDSEKEPTEGESDEDEDEDEDESPIKKSAKSDDEKESDDKKSPNDKKDGDDKDDKTGDKESESDDKKSDKKSDEKSSDKKSKSDKDDEESSDSFADRFFSTDDDESDEESDDESDDVPVSDDEDVPDGEIDIEEEPLEESDVAAIEEVIGKKMSELIDTVREMLGGEADTDVNPMIAEGTVDLNPGTDPFCACDTPEAMDSLTRSIDDLMNDRLKGLRGYDGKMYKVVKSEAETKREKTEQLKRSLGSKAVYHMTGEEVLNAINGLTGGDLETIRKSSSYLYPYDIIIRVLDAKIGSEKTDSFVKGRMVNRNSTVPGQTIGESRAKKAVDQFGEKEFKHKRPKKRYGVNIDMDAYPAFFGTKKDLLSDNRTNLIRAFIGIVDDYKRYVDKRREVLRDSDENRMFAAINDALGTNYDSSSNSVINLIMKDPAFRHLYDNDFVKQAKENPETFIQGGGKDKFAAIKDSAYNRYYSGLMEKIRDFVTVVNALEDASITVPEHYVYKLAKQMWLDAANNGNDEANFGAVFPKKFIEGMEKVFDPKTGFPLNGQYRKKREEWQGKQEEMPFRGKNNALLYGNMAKALFDFEPIKTPINRIPDSTGPVEEIPYRTIYNMSLASKYPKRSVYGLGLLSSPTTNKLPNTLESIVKRYSKSPDDVTAWLKSNALNNIWSGSTGGYKDPNMSDTEISDIFSGFIDSTPNTGSVATQDNSNSESSNPSDSVGDKDKKKVEDAEKKLKKFMSGGV